MKKLSSALALAAVLGFSVQANAAGYQLTEYSTTGLGRSFAGAGLVGDDYSAVAYNPAGMAYTTRSGAQLGFSTFGIRSSAKGTVTNLMGANAAGKENPYIVRVLPHGFAQYRLNDKTVLGLGIYTPFGLATDYKNGWFGKTHAGRSEIQTLNVSPALSVNVTDSVALGGALNLQHSRADLTSEVERNMGTGPTYLAGKAHLRGHDTSLGYTLGATWEPVKNQTRFGVSYRSKVVHDLRGKNTASDLALLGIHPLPAYNGTKNIKTKITTPETITLSAWQRLNKQWSVSATARWTRWNRFRNLDIYEMNGKEVSKTKENWRNTWFYSLGADYQYCKNLIFRFGGAYDQSTVKNPEYRTARIPDGRRIWTSLGFSYMKNNWQLDGGYAHLFVKTVKAKHGNTGASEFDAKYRSNANLFSLAVQYKF